MLLCVPEPPEPSNYSHKLQEITTLPTASHVSESRGGIVLAPLPDSQVFPETTAPFEDPRLERYSSVDSPSVGSEDRSAQIQKNSG